MYLCVGNLQAYSTSREIQLWLSAVSISIAGRLTDPNPGSSSTCGLESSEPVCIAPQSWYICTTRCMQSVFSHYATFSLGVNYYMSVLPFLAAVQTGVVGKGEIQLHIQVPAEAAQDYCSSFTDCSTKYPDAMTKWETFFQVSGYSR